MSDTLMVSVSGVRGLVGTDLTPEVIARWAGAFGAWSQESGVRGGKRGRRATVVLGRDARDFVIPPEEAEAFGAVLEYICSTGLSSPQVGHWMTKDGGRRLLESLWPFRSGAIPAA